MADDHASDAQRAAVRDRFRAARAQVAVLTDDGWDAERDGEVRVVREWAAQRRRSAA